MGPSGDSVPLREDADPTRGHPHDGVVVVQRKAPEGRGRLRSFDGRLRRTPAISYRNDLEGGAFVVEEPKGDRHGARRLLGAPHHGLHDGVDVVRIEQGGGHRLHRLAASRVGSQPPARRLQRLLATPRQADRELHQAGERERCQEQTERAHEIGVPGNDHAHQPPSTPDGHLPGHSVRRDRRVAVQGLAAIHHHELGVGRELSLYQGHELVGAIGRRHVADLGGRSVLDRCERDAVPIQGCDDQEPGLPGGGELQRGGQLGSAGSERGARDRSARRIVAHIEPEDRSTEPVRRGHRDHRVVARPMGRSHVLTETPRDRRSPARWRVRTRGGRDR